MFERYAIFYTPVGLLADFGASWLGWDNATGRSVPQPTIHGLDIASFTKAPRKYGLHATLKAPFVLGQDFDLKQLKQEMGNFSKQSAAFGIGKLELRHDRGFIALRPVNEVPQLQEFAAHIVKAFDKLRAPLSSDDITRRRKRRLTSRQNKQMLEWGYPYIFDDFNFHLALTGRLSSVQIRNVIAALSSDMNMGVSDTIRIDAITLMGQDKLGMFYQIIRYPLA